MIACRFALRPSTSVLTRYGTPQASSHARTSAISSRLDLPLVVSNDTSRASNSAEDAPRDGRPCGSAMLGKLYYGSATGNEPNGAANSRPMLAIASLQEI